MTINVTTAIVIVITWSLHMRRVNTSVIVEVRSEVRKCAKVMASPQAGKVVCII